MGFATMTVAPFHGSALAVVSAVVVAGFLYLLTASVRIARTVVLTAPFTLRAVVVAFDVAATCHQRNAGNGTEFEKQFHATLLMLCR